MQTSWVSSREAAAELGISLRTLQALLVRGLILGAREARDWAAGSLDNPISGHPDPG